MEYPIVRLISRFPIIKNVSKRLFLSPVHELLVFSIRKSKMTSLLFLLDDLGDFFQVLGFLVSIPVFFFFV